jgi:polar amino acid transport system substrate-binding protein
MKPLNILAVVLAMALLVSLSINAAVYSVNTQLSSDNSAASTQVQMETTLAKAQMYMQGAFKKIDAAMVNASVNLAPYGLNGTQARSVLNASLAVDSSMINVLTFDTAGVVIAAEPTSSYALVGKDLSWAPDVQRLLSTRMPQMNDVLRNPLNVSGAVLVAPVFDANGVFLGGVGTLFNASALMGRVVPPLLVGTEFTTWCIQGDGVEVYDTDPTQIGLNITGPDYNDYPTVQAMGWRMINETSGYITYSFATSLHSGVQVTKECYWTSIGMHGVMWRLAIVHRL